MSSYGIGSTVRLSTTIRNDTGTVVDPSAVSVAVRLPDTTVAGPYTTLTTPAVVRDGVGTYHLDYATEVAGPHAARWTSTGPSTSTEFPFDVEPAWGDVGIISLLDAKNHLKKKVSGTIDDEKLLGVLLSATDLIHDRVGQVVPVTLTEDHYGRGSVIVLRKRPVVSVTSVQRFPGGTMLPAQDMAAGVRGWELTSPEGVLETATRFGNVRVTYRAGRVPTPHRFRLACKELVSHLWRTSQLSGDGGRPPIQGDQQVPSSAQFALPYNVRQLLGLDRNSRDMPTIG